jgi:hypothetical protein
MEVSECRFEGERRRLVLKLNFEAENAPIAVRRMLRALCPVQHPTISLCQRQKQFAPRR